MCSKIIQYISCQIWNDLRLNRNKVYHRLHIVTIRLKTKFSSARNTPITFTNNLLEKRSARGLVNVILANMDVSIKEKGKSYTN